VGEISLALIPAGDNAALAAHDIAEDWDIEPGSGVQTMKFGRQSAAPLGPGGNQ
jgi:hypothetical protein